MEKQQALASKRAVLWVLVLVALPFWSVVALSNYYLYLVRSRVRTAPAVASEEAPPARLPCLELRLRGYLRRGPVPANFTPACPEIRRRFPMGNYREVGDFPIPKRPMPSGLATGGSPVVPRSGS